MLLALWAVRRTPVLSWVALLLGVPAMCFTVLEAFNAGTDWIVLVNALLHAPFYFYVSYAMIRYLFHDNRVTRDELYATGAAFTVVAWGFAYVYAAAQVVWPGSFAGAGGPADRTWFELLFLSFTTLTSVGLSDVVPVLAHARSLVVIEQVAGVLYVALVVSRLVGLTVAHSRSGLSAGGSARGEAVARAGHGGDPLARPARAPQLAADVPDVDVDEEVRLDELALPHLAHQLAAGPRVPGPRGHGRQQVDLRRGERHRDAVQLHDLPGRVDRQAGARDRHRCGRRLGGRPDDDPAGSDAAGGSRRGRRRSAWARARTSRGENGLAR